MVLQVVLILLFLNARNMKWIFLPALLISLHSCAPDPNLLDGAWHISGYYQDGQSIAASLDSVSLIFLPDQAYKFHSTGFYQETGKYRTSGSYLFLLDSTAKEPKERALKILFLSHDSLKIEMRRDSVEQVLFFAKNQ